MKFLSLFTLSALLLFSTQAYAATETLKIGVNGMVCDFCVQGLKKTFSKVDAVEKIDVSLSDKLLTLALKPNQKLDDETVRKIITDNGLTPTTIEREVQ